MARVEEQVGIVDQRGTRLVRVGAQRYQEAGGAQPVQQREAGIGREADDLRHHPHVRQACAESRADTFVANVPPSAQLPLDRRRGRGDKDRSGHAILGGEWFDLHPLGRVDAA